jgi:thiamine pyrophosphokinase
MESKLMPVLVFANGTIPDPTWIEPYFAEATAVIAANGGTRHLFALGRRPDILVGDMDSLPDEVNEWLANGRTTFVTRPADKDETDLELALLYAVAHYDAPILLFGALGGRLDQTIGNILLLAHPGLRGRPIYLVEQHERAWLITGQTRIEGAAGDTVSLIPLAGDVQIAETTNLRWPLHQETLRFGLGRGISNAQTAAVATVQVQQGLLLCVHSHQKKD